MPGDSNIALTGWLVGGFKATSCNLLNQLTRWHHFPIEKRQLNSSKPSLKMLKTIYLVYPSSSIQAVIVPPNIGDLLLNISGAFCLPKKIAHHTSPNQHRRWLQGSIWASIQRPPVTPLWGQRKISAEWNIMKHHPNHFSAVHILAKRQHNKCQFGTIIAIACFNPLTQSSISLSFVARMS